MKALILPVKMLKGVTFNDQAALDIVLEDAVKDTWQGEATLSGGASLRGETDTLYDNRLLAMLFSKRKSRKIQNKSKLSVPLFCSLSDFYYISSKKTKTATIFVRGKEVCVSRKVAFMHMSSCTLVYSKV